MIEVRELTYIDVSIAGVAAFVGVNSLNTAIGLWRVRFDGNLLLRGLVFKLVAFTAWTFEIFGQSMYEWHERIPVSSLVQGMANLDRLTLIVPMGMLLIWIVPAVAKPSRQIT